MNIPTLQQCYELFDQYKVPSTVRTHCGMVFTVASSLAQRLKDNNYSINPDIIKPFALLHDFMKVVVLERLTDPPYNYQPTQEEIAMHQHLRQQYKGLSETKVAYLILKGQYPDFAQLFIELDQLTRNPHAKVSEETKFIHYIDWRVLGNSIVPLAERSQYIHQKYGVWIKEQNIDWEATKQEQYNYQQKIFKHLPFPPEELPQQIRMTT